MMLKWPGREEGNGSEKVERDGCVNAPQLPSKCLYHTPMLCMALCAQLQHRVHSPTHAHTHDTHSLVIHVLWPSSCTFLFRADVHVCTTKLLFLSRTHSMTLSFTHNNSLSHTHILTHSHTHSLSRIHTLHLTHTFTHTGLPAPMADEDAVAEFQEGLTTYRNSGASDHKGGNNQGTRSDYRSANLSHCAEKM